MDSFDKLREVNKQLIAEMRKQSAEVAFKPWRDFLGRVDDVPKEFADMVEIDAPEIGTKIRLLWLGGVQVLKDGEWTNASDPSAEVLKQWNEDKAAYKRECYWAHFPYAALNAFKDQVEAMCSIKDNPLHAVQYTFLRNLLHFMQLIAGIVYTRAVYKEADGRLVQWPGWGLAAVPWVDIPFISTQRMSLKGKDVWMLRLYKEPQKYTVLWNGCTDPADPIDESMASILHNYIDLMSAARMSGMICGAVSGRTVVELSPTCDLFNPEAAGSN